MRGKTIGDQELALLQHIEEQRHASVGEVAAAFGEPRGLARQSLTTRWAMPVASSVSSLTDRPSTRSSKRTTPPTSVRIGVV